MEPIRVSMRGLLGSRHPQNRAGRRGSGPDDPTTHRTMTNDQNPQKTGAESLRDEFLSQFDQGSQRYRVEKARTSVLQTTFHELSREAWGGADE